MGKLDETGAGVVTTTIHSYCFSLPTEYDAYQALCERLQGMGLKCFATWRQDAKYPRCSELNMLTVALETSSLFPDQWDTAPIPSVSDSGLRVFDWHEEIYNNPGIKEGYWLEQTTSMAEARRNTLKCGYCGRQERTERGSVFCPACIDSEYLKESELFLTRLVPVTETDKPRAQLTEAEAAHLVPLYRDAQIHGSTERGKARIANNRAKIEAKYRRVVANAEAEHKGFIWLMDHGVEIGNVIFYDHTGRFCFGWRTPLSESVLSGLLDIISEFPYPYTLKGESRTLEGS